MDPSNQSEKKYDRFGSEYSTVKLNSSSTPIAYPNRPLGKVKSYPIWTAHRFCQLMPSAVHPLLSHFFFSCHPLDQLIPRVLWGFTGHCRFCSTENNFFFIFSETKISFSSGNWTMVEISKMRKKGTISEEDVSALLQRSLQFFSRFSISV